MDGVSIKLGITMTTWQNALMTSKPRQIDNMLTTIKLWLTTCIKLYITTSEARWCWFHPTLRLAGIASAPSWDWEDLGAEHEELEAFRPQLRPRPPWQRLVDRESRSEPEVPPPRKRQKGPKWQALREMRLSLIRPSIVFGKAGNGMTGVSDMCEGGIWNLCLSVLLETPWPWNVLNWQESWKKWLQRNAQSSQRDQKYSNPTILQIPQRKPGRTWRLKRFVTASPLNWSNWQVRSGPRV